MENRLRELEGLPPLPEPPSACQSCVAVRSFLADLAELCSSCFRQRRTTWIRLVPKPGDPKAARNHVVRFPSRHHYASHLCPFQAYAQQRVPLPAYGSIRKCYRRSGSEKVQALVGKVYQQDLLARDVDRRQLFQTKERPDLRLETTASTQIAPPRSARRRNQGRLVASRPRVDPRELGRQEVKRALSRCRSHRQAASGEPLL